MKLPTFLLYMFLHLTPTLLKPTKRAITIESCDSLVYCQGILLDTIQLAQLYPDSKTFVDFSLVNSPEITVADFNNLMASTDNQPSKSELQQFVAEYFKNDSELIQWTPPDWTSTPKILGRIKDKEIRKFAQDLVDIWPSLGRKVSQDVIDNPEKHSLIGVPNGLIIPGGRFREFYYWDTYWIIEGLVLSDMVQTARGIIENFFVMVEKYGFIPNGGRVYYLNRSQPPLLTLMASVYFQKTRDMNWLKTNIKYLDKELTYWLEQKTITINKDGCSYTMARYFSKSTTPRPESYFEDVSTCSYFLKAEEKEHCYQGLKTGAESGWDFSSRWLFDELGGVNTNLTHIDAQRVAPVDLNAFLAQAFQKLSEFYVLLEDVQSARKWLSHYKTFQTAIDEVLYHEEDGIWYDYDIVLNQPRKMFFPSNFAPLYTNSINPTRRDEFGQKAAHYFDKMDIEQFKGGIPTSLDLNNEQWDMPNAWPPLQEIVILGLWNSGNPHAEQIAKKSSKRWIEANLIGYNTENAMFEKYDATKVGQYGGGGEYQVQRGFGWTNGVALNLIDKFYTKK